MVRIRTARVGTVEEPVDQLGQDRVAQGHMPRSERRDDLDTALLKVDTPEHDDFFETDETRPAQRVNLVARRRMKCRTTPCREPLTKPGRVVCEQTADEFVAPHDQQSSEGPA